MTPDAAPRRLSHVHVRVRDFAAAMSWFREVLGASPVYEDAEMAVYRFDGAGLILDRNESDDGSIVAFRVPDCDAAFRDATQRGAAPLEPPEDKPYGVRSAYVRGPGGLTVEFEQPR